MENLIYNLMFQEKKNTHNYWNELREMETDFFSYYINCKNFKREKKLN